jgi:hypothetical protein
VGSLGVERCDVLAVEPVDELGEVDPVGSHRLAGVAGQESRDCSVQLLTCWVGVDVDELAERVG